MVDEVFKVELVQGNTMIIPSGWIHAVVSIFLCLFLPGTHDMNSILQLTLWFLVATFYTHMVSKHVCEG